jgi:uncharacterized protein
MNKSQFLLFPVFDKLRRQGVPLGVSEFLIVIKLMWEGGGESLDNVDDLRRLCRLLWAKSREDQDLFDEVFFNEVEVRLRTLAQPEDDSSKLKQSISTRFDLSEAQKEEPEFRKEQNPETETTPQEQKKEQLAASPSPLRLPLPDEISLIEESDELTHKFQLTPRLHIDRRDMVGPWRHLRRLQREGPLEELDVEGTIKYICRNGIFLQPVLQARRRNQAKLVLLIDQSRSMEPFGLLIQAFVESVLKSGLHKQTKLFYFHDCPERYLYEKPELVGPKHIEEVLANNCKSSSVLIISDAGAARGYYDRNRIEDSKAFLKALGDFTYLYAWLNPMPADRWIGTTAEDIRLLVPMYPLDRDGVNDAVNILRGHPFPPEIRLNA